MKKIGIITLNGYFNYGNRLQNYAVQEVLKLFGYYVETLIVDINKNQEKDKNRSLFKKNNSIKERSFVEIMDKINKKIWLSINKKNIEKARLNRTEIFKKFTKDFINETDFRINENNIPSNLADDYEYFVTGSDQVWNPDYMSGSSIYFLTFAPKEKRIAFSPSFGVSEIPFKYQSNYKKWIREIEHLSVREDAGAKIIKDLTGKDAKVLLDPTMMLTKEKWLSISSRPKNVGSTKYLLTYFLGGVPREYRDEINKIVKDNNLEIINLANIKDSETYQTGPSEFIQYINSASVFCTDSFHGAVFSILLETPFIVFQRKGNSPSMYSRIDTLLNTFDLNSRKASNIITNEEIFNIDFSHIPEILEYERNKTLTYLSKALGGKN
ncbi:polysaccharide pyruvyl transferase family protein [Halalkalibacterium halodurans]|uniref:Polysaccharide pyruvyl transferase domain-containing protein n=1 Tax=Halalkalibacterium halodurans TaxID=86665 RepID=A0A0M0KFL9_ALKHA|nr:polysaccharide pyruvyl transferase family protein [Halalkalibacterium halodurans]TPE68975.1 polysaccharide pyruvyl transferase family protein [Halalkalibacterium halodurans]